MLASACCITLFALAAGDQPGKVFPLVPSWASSFKDGAAVQHLITHAIASGARSVHIPAGNYKFTADVKILTIMGATKLDVYGDPNMPNATSFWFFPGYGVEILSCVDLTLRGVSTDTITAPHSQGKIVSTSFDSDPPTLVVDIDAGFPLLTDQYLFNKTCPGDSPGTCSEIKVVYWDANTRLITWAQGMDNPMTAANCSKATRRCEAQIRSLDPNTHPKPGSLVTFSSRLWATNAAIPTYYRGTYLVYNCTRALFERIDTYGSADMVWVEVLGGGVNTYRNVNIIRRTDPPYTPRLLASNLDTFHSMSVEKGPTIEDCEVSFVADDFINVHNRLLPLQSFDLAAGTASIVDVGLTPGPVNHEGFQGITHVMPFVQRGDELKLYHLGVGLERDLIGTLVVASANRVHGVVPVLPKPLNNRVVTSGLELWLVTFDARASTLPTKKVANYTVVVQMDRFSGVGALVQRNYFHDTYNNVGRFAASDLVYRNNTIERAGDAVHVSYDISGFNFLEGSLGVRNITLVGNTFTDVHPGGHACTDMSCILDHVDPGLLGQVHAAGNKVVASRH
jgi:hypothetical protein